MALLLSVGVLWNSTAASAPPGSPTTTTEPPQASTPNRVALDQIPPVVVPSWALCPQWWQLASDVGWQETELPTLDYVLWKESRCDPTVHNPDDPQGGSFGLAQVNGFWKKYLLLNRVTDLFTPRVNLAGALRIWQYANDKHGNGWGPWNI